MSESLPACITLPKLPEVLDFLYTGLSEDFKKNLNRFFYWPWIFLLNSKHPWVSEEGWNSIKNQQAIRGKMPHLAQLLFSRQTHTHTCMRQSWFVLQQRSILQGVTEELKVWEGRVSICGHSPAESKVVFRNSHCLIEDKVS